MTIVNAHSSTHFGRLVTASGDAIDVGLELIGGRTLRMSLDGQELGAWPVEDCHITPDPSEAGTYLMTVDGDDAVFTPEDESLFDAFVGGLDGAAPDDGETDLDREPEPEDADDVSAFLFGGARRQDPPEPAPSVTPSDDDVAEASDEDTEVVGTVVTEPSDDVVEDVDVDGDVDPVAEEFPAHAAAFVIDEPAADPEDDAVSDTVDTDSAWDVDAATDDPVEDTQWVELAIDKEDEQGSPDEEADLEPEPMSLSAALFRSRGSSTTDPSDDGVGIGEDPDTEGSPSPAGDDATDDPIGLVPFADGPEDGGDRSDADSITTGARFSGSSLERLSSAIGALKQSRDTRDEPTTDEADGDEEYTLDPNTVADDVLASQRSLRGHAKVSFLTPERIKLGAIVGGVLVVLVALGVMAPRVWSFVTNYESEPPTPSTLVVQEERITTTTTIVTTTTIPTTTLPAPQPGDTIFDLPVQDFIDAWNAEGVPIDQVLRFDTPVASGVFQQEFTAYLKMTGEVGSDGTLSTFSLIVDPTGPTEYDRIGIQALGVAIATVDPTRSPSGRATLLGNLGLNVRQPQLGGIDGEVESAGIDYTLVYDENARLLTLTVTPTG